MNFLSNIEPEIMPFLPTKMAKVLEIGCNEGLFASSLMTLGREVWGVEINPEAAEIAERNITKVVVGDYESIFDELPKNYFDCVVFNDVLEHMYFPWKTLEKTKSLLTKDGIVVTSLPNFRYITNLKEILLEQNFRYKKSGILETSHFRFFTLKSTLLLFEKAGYQIIRSEGINENKNWKLKLLSILSFGLFTDVKYMQIATSAKPM